MVLGGRRINSRRGRKKREKTREERERGESDRNRLCIYLAMFLSSSQPDDV